MKRASTISYSIEISFRFIGLWPDLSYASFYWLSYITSIGIVQYYQYAYIIAHFTLDDLWLLMDCLSLTLGYTLACVKLCVLWRNRGIFHNIVRAMEQDWKECAVNDSYVSTMTSMSDLAQRFSNVLFAIYAFSTFFLTIGEHMLQSVDDANRMNNHSRELPIKMELPFEVSNSPIFECFLVIQFIYDLIIASVVGFINAMLVSLILHVSGQIDILRQNLVDISNGKYNRGTFLIVIRNIIHKHQRIITLSENIENLYTHIALIQLLWNTLVICCTGFVIITTISSGKDATGLIKSVSYYVAITLEAFIFCFAGEYLSAKSKSIGDAVYDSLWYDMPSSDSRILFFMMVRCQKRLTITAGRVVDLTLEGFTNIMKASVSYVSVLNAMY
ncbi:odorant receptor 22c-like [Pseudomyrmex gracilis]|uniref:odorant receptor 22c-like n=1 Tax=Pseudomyrmex gracilis TaxID=219809 RepID=UPI000994AB30|nr:odorant receptor 22c-like [Pseudomyrmex gracilis]